MASPRTSGVRSFLVGVLAFVLTLTGVGRGFAGIPAPDEISAAIPGVHIPICHSAAGGTQAPADPARPAGHDCCDACALSAAAVVPELPFLSAPASASHFAAHGRAVAWAPSPARARSPRQSQGPPVA